MVDGPGKPCARISFEGNYDDGVNCDFNCRPIVVHSEMNFFHFVSSYKKNDKIELSDQVQLLFQTLFCG